MSCEYGWWAAVEIGVGSFGGGRERRLIFGDVHGLPFTARDAFADLRRSFAFARLFVGVQIFANANLATGAVFADETIEQTGMALAAVAMAIAGLLIQNFFDARGDGVGVLHYGIAKSVRAHGGGESACGSLIVEGWNALIIVGLRNEGEIVCAGNGLLWQQQQGERKTEKNGGGTFAGEGHEFSVL
jgi:hypothetical protein